MTIDQNTVLSLSLLKTVNYNGISEDTFSLALNSFLYTHNVINFGSLSNNTVIFYLNDLPVHKKLLVRARVYSDCQSHQNQTIILTLEGENPRIVNKILIEHQ